MRLFTSIGALICVLAASAVATTTASASILPGAAGTSIAGGSEKLTLQVKGGASVTCPKSTLSGEVLSASSGLAVIKAGSGCTSAGLPFNTLGDESGVWLLHVEIEECPANPEILVLRLLPAHLEVPSTGLLLIIEGALLGTVKAGTKAEAFALTITQKSGKNTVETCGKTTDILLTSTDGGSFVQSGLEAKNASLTFGAEEEFM